MSGFEIKENNRLAVNLTNNNPKDTHVTFLALSWESAEIWAEALGYNDIRVDWFSWNGVRFYSGNDYDSPTERSAYLLLSAGTTSTWEVDFDWSGEESWAFTDEFGLTQENFGFAVQIDNCVALVRPEIVSYPPEPDCGSYSIGDFSFGDYAHVLVDITNDDLLDTRITSIELNWDYAESYDALVAPDSELNIDFINYGGWGTWGDFDGSARDFDSPTNTSFDSPETFPGSWSSYGLPPFEAGETNTLDIDFDGEWSTFTTDLVSGDFGVTFTFENGCILTKAAVPRPLPTPNCETFSVSDFVMHQDNRTAASVTNDDIIPTEIERIVFDWGQAEALANGIIGPNNLYADWFMWDYNFIWGINDDSIGDFSSVTDTSVDFPELWFGPVDFKAGDAINFEVGFNFALNLEDENTFQNWGLAPENFGVTFYFGNGCILVYPAVE